MGWPDNIGIMAMSGDGVGGVIVGRNADCVPTVYWMKWLDNTKENFETEAD
jgi:hypothetical protein